MRKPLTPFCGPSDKNGAASAVTAPAVPGPGVHIPKVPIKRKARFTSAQLELCLSGESSPVVQAVKLQCSPPRLQRGAFGVGYSTFKPA